MHPRHRSTFVLHYNLPAQCSQPNKILYFAVAAMHMVVIAITSSSGYSLVPFSWWSNQIGMSQCLSECIGTVASVPKRNPKSMDIQRAKRQGSAMHVAIR